MGCKEYTHKVFERVKIFWNRLPINRKGIIIVFGFLAMLVVFVEPSIKFKFLNYSVKKVRCNVH